MSINLDFPKRRLVLTTPCKRLDTTMLREGIFNPLDVREQVNVN